MDRKLLNTIMLIVIAVLIIIGGSIYTYWNQKNTIDEKKAKIKELSLNAFDTEELTRQLEELQTRARELDSILALRKFNIPANLRQSAFFEFINKISFSFQSYSYVNIVYKNTVIQQEFNLYNYTLSGVASFNDLYKLIYGIEESKELKKINKTKFDYFITVDDEGLAHYLVNYEIQAEVYFANNDRFASADFKENQIKPNPLYDIFFPLIRNEIPPNTDNLLDVQAATLLALIPDGAFLANDKGETYLLWEGDKVYLGYLTEIDYNLNEVRFVLNKGGIIEKVTLQLDNEINTSK